MLQQHNTFLATEIFCIILESTSLKPDLEAELEKKAKPEMGGEAEVNAEADMNLYGPSLLNNNNPEEVQSNTSTEKKNMATDTDLYTELIIAEPSFDGLQRISKLETDNEILCGQLAALELYTDMIVQRLVEEGKDKPHN